MSRDEPDNVGAPYAAPEPDGWLDYVMILLGVGGVIGAIRSAPVVGLCIAAVWISLAHQIHS